MNANGHMMSAERGKKELAGTISKRRWSRNRCAVLSVYGVCELECFTRWRCSGFRFNEPSFVVFLFRPFMAFNLMKELFILFSLYWCSSYVSYCCKSFAFPLESLNVARLNITLMSVFTYKRGMGYECPSTFTALPTHLNWGLSTYLNCCMLEPSSNELGESIHSPKQLLNRKCSKITKYGLRQAKKYCPSSFCFGHLKAPTCLGLFEIVLLHF